MSQLELQNVSYAYIKDKYILKDISYQFEKDKIYAICGKSGAGKTTLLSLLSRLTKPSEGTILFEDQDISKISQYEYRSKNVGVIFQSFNLLPQYSAIENVILSMNIAGIKNVNKKAEAISLLHKVGLDEDEQNRKILKLSGGQQQRVAIARALASDPKVILADEPTGNLDKETEAEILNIFKRIAYEEHKCIIIVTHSKEVANIADETYNLVKYQRD